MDDLWQGVIGQEKIKKFFDSLFVSEHLPQGLIICGPKGTGKDFIAARFAHQMNIWKGNLAPGDFSHPFSQVSSKYVFALPRGKNEESFDDPYEKLTKDKIAEIREQIDLKNANPYLNMVIEGANEIKINSIRDIQKFLSYTSGTVYQKCVIISQAEGMNEEAQNSLLKQIEEPPEDTTFLLTTSNPAMLRETIRSRCWELSTTPFSEAEIAQILVQYFHVPFDTADTISRFSDGSLENASILLEKDLLGLKQNVIEFLRYALADRVNSAYTILSSLVQKEGEDSVYLLFKMICLWLADAEKYKYNSEHLFFSDFKDTFSKFYSRYKVKSFEPYIREVENYVSLLKNNNINLNIVFFNLIHLLASIINKKYTPAL